MKLAEFEACFEHAQESVQALPFKVKIITSIRKVKQTLGNTLGAGFEFEVYDRFGHYVCSYHTGSPFDASVLTEAIDQTVKCMKEEV